jgi:hypothetical protein
MEVRAASVRLRPGVLTRARRRARRRRGAVYSSSATVLRPTFRDERGPASVANTL